MRGRPSSRGRFPVFISAFAFAFVSASAFTSTFAFALKFFTRTLALTLMPMLTLMLIVTLTLMVTGVTGCVSKSVYESQADREGIRETVRLHLREVRDCYEKAIDERPGAEGKVVLEFDIGVDGRATAVRVKDAGPKITHIAPCLSERLKSWQFPAPLSNEIVTVAYPFFFSENGRFHQ